MPKLPFIYIKKNKMWVFHFDQHIRQNLRHTSMKIELILWASDHRWGGIALILKAHIWVVNCTMKAILWASQKVTWLKNQVNTSERKQINKNWPMKLYCKCIRKIWWYNLLFCWVQRVMHLGQNVILMLC
jgi:hypothetical protein